MRRLICAIVFFHSLCTIPVYGGIETTAGSEPNLWDVEPGYSVIVARVLSLKKVGNRAEEMGGSHIATFEPLATLAGHFDPSAASSIEVRYYAGEYGTSIKDAAPVGSVVLAVICRKFIDRELKHSTIAVVPDVCTFMPDRSALVQITGIDDKRVSETLKRIREACAKAGQK